MHAHTPASTHTHTRNRLPIHANYTSFSYTHSLSCSLASTISLLAHTLCLSNTHILCLHSHACLISLPLSLTPALYLFTTSLSHPLSLPLARSHAVSPFHFNPPSFRRLGYLSDEGVVTIKGRAACAVEMLQVACVHMYDSTCVSYACRHAYV